VDLGLKGKTAFISGGSRGIGFAIAASFAAEGARVAITARGADALEQARVRLAETAGEANVVALQADMRLESDIAGALEETEARLGPLHAVIANAGSGSAQSGIELDRAAWQGPLDANLMSSVLLAGLALPLLVAQGSGSMAFMASIAGVEAISAPLPYAVAKTGLLMAMKSYARQVGRHGVRVNAIAPGNIFFPGGTWADKFQDPDKKAFFTDYINDEVAMRRFATPKEIADTVVFMASRRASFMTGSVVVIDGGQTRSFI